MSQLQTDPTTGDLALEGATLTLVDGEDEIAQHARVRLRLIRGEVPARQDLGMDFFGVLLIKGASSSDIEGAVRDALLGTPGIVQVDEIEIGDIDPATRTLRVSFSALAQLSNLAERIPLHDAITVQLQGVP
jgi:uncharacterized membrane protein YeiH